MNTDERRVCGECHRLGALNRCGYCKIIHYCNRECQTKDWVRHKVWCVASTKSMELERTIELFAKAARSLVGPVPTCLCTEEDNKRGITVMFSQLLQKTTKDSSSSRGVVYYVKEVLNDARRNRFFRSFVDKGLTEKEAWQYFQTGTCSSICLALVEFVQKAWWQDKSVTMKGDVIKEVLMVSVSMDTEKGGFVPFRSRYFDDENKRYEDDRFTYEHHHVVFLIGEKKNWMVDMSPYQYGIDRSWKDAQDMPYIIDDVTTFMDFSKGAMIVYREEDSSERYYAKTNDIVLYSHPSRDPSDFWSEVNVSFRGGDNHNRGFVLSELMIRLYHHHNVHQFNALNA